MKVIGVLLFGGIGTRVGAILPKQFIEVCGKTILEHTIEKFEQHPKIDKIVIVSNSNYIDLVYEYINKNKWNKISSVVPGGKERSDSSIAAINACLSIENDAHILIHDGIRPLVTNKIISDVAEALQYHNSVNVVFPVRETIIEVRNNILYNVPDRSTLYTGQSPQGFRLSTLVNAYKEAIKDPYFKATDDCGVVMKYLPNEVTSTIIGDENNLKFTYESDLLIIQHLLLKQQISQ
ncbi:hypothetical protein MASR1M31_05020 [Porphyromonadaceae bacterium]